MSDDQKQQTMKRRELEWLLRDYGASRTVRVALASQLPPDGLDRLVRKLRPWRLWKPS